MCENLYHLGLFCVSYMLDEFKGLNREALLGGIVGMAVDHLKIKKKSLLL